jgi:hypothetical protein
MACSSLRQEENNLLDIATLSPMLHLSKAVPYCICSALRNRNSALPPLHAANVAAIPPLPVLP